MPAPNPTCTTIPQLFAATAAARRDEPALGVIVGGQVAWRSWGELAADVAACRSALVDGLGVQRGDRVAQFSPNCLPWVIVDLAIQECGAVHVPLHASLAGVQAGEQIAHSGARVAVVQNDDYAARLRASLPAGVRVATHAELDRLAADGGQGRAAAAELGPDDLATVLYTSGTTGPPLGVMLTQRNLVSNAVATTEAAAPSGDEVRLGLLPLSHIYARTCDLYCWLVFGGRLVLAESRETIFRDLTIVAPSAINAVPYFYQKVVDRLREAGGAMDDSALREVLGGAIERCYSGGAALAPDVDRFFAERGLPILCGYGLTEASPVICATPPGGYCSGTVGPPIAGVEVRLADDGEILTRGPHVMRGYWHDEAATARVLQDGWLSTGDLGEWAAAGRLRIVGRKKEMIVLATGKKVAPTRVEELLVGSPWVEQACVVGDGRKCLAALIVPHGDTLRREIKRRRLVVWSSHRALHHPQVRVLYREEINRCLAGLAEFEQVGAFELLDRAFSLDEGEVTPKQSLCRKVIQRRFAEQIDAMYRSMSARC